MVIVEFGETPMTIPVESFRGGLGGVRAFGSLGEQLRSLSPSTNPVSRTAAKQKKSGWKGCA